MLIVVLKASNIILVVYKFVFVLKFSFPTSGTTNNSNFLPLTLRIGGRVHYPTGVEKTYLMFTKV